MLLVVWDRQGRLTTTVVDTTTYQPAFQPTIREMPIGERPKERIREYCANHLSNTELIAILPRTGIQGENVLALPSRMLAQFDGLAGLGRVTFHECCGERGLSEAKVSQLLAAL